LFSLLSGWNYQDVSLDLYGTQTKPINLNSGDRVYQLPNGLLWSHPKKLTRLGRIIWSIELLRMLLLRHNEFDIVHYHTFNWGVFLSPLLLHPLGKKVVFTMSLFGNDNPGYIRQQPRGRLQVELMQKFDGAIGLAPALVNDAKKNGIRNVICLPNFLAIPQLEEPIEASRIQEVRNLARSKLGIPRESKVILFVGSIICRKGVDVLIDTFIELSQKFPSLVLMLVGPQSEQETTGIDETYVSQLKEKIHQARLERQVFWAGMVKEQTLLVKYYRSADIFVFPTRNEGSPNVIAEAMSAGLPVVASLLPGITDAVVSDGESGYLVEPDHSDQFYSAIDQLLQDDIKREAMGAAGRKIALEKFGFTSYTQRLREFYLDLLDKKNGHD
jgi:glycosyltransferase involved in cell wall biosynthesis